MMPWIGVLARTKAANRRIKLFIVRPAGVPAGLTGAGVVAAGRARFFACGAAAVTLAFAVPCYAQGGVAPAATPSANELVPNGGFELQDPGGKPDNNVQSWWTNAPGARWEWEGENRVLRVDRGHGMSWERPGKAIGGARYQFSFRMKARDLPQVRLCLWTQLPEKDGPEGGPKFTRYVKGTFDWTQITMPLQMPEGISRFRLFFDGFGNTGTAWFDDFSLVPVQDSPLELGAEAPVWGSQEREQLNWIWSEPGFPWKGKMNRDSTAAVAAQEVWFRRRVTFSRAPQAATLLFTADDRASVFINGARLADNEMVQNTVSLPLASHLKPGANEVLFKAHNRRGPAGLLARLQWVGDDGLERILTTNAAWECSTDQGQSWKSAAPVAVPAPAPTQFHWVYPHLRKLSYSLECPLPADTRGVRMALRSTGGARVMLGQRSWETASCGQVVKTEWENPSNAGTLKLAFEDIEQPPAGQLAVQTRGADGVYRDLPLTIVKAASGARPAQVKALFPERTWPVNIGAFLAAATRKRPDFSGRLEPWARQLLQGATPVFRVGQDDDSSSEFGDWGAGGTGSVIPVPVKDTRNVPRGLEARLRPEVTLGFTVGTLPPHGTALVLDVEDTDAMVATVGVFVNGVFCGSPQLIGYDQVPGGRQTQRCWVVTLAPERLRIGANTVTLRLLPSFYAGAEAGVENQAEEYISQLNLRNRKENPYPTSSWLHFDHVSLMALAKAAPRYINGRPVSMGTNMAYISASGLANWRDFVFRDLTYLGLAYTGAPLRYGLSNGGQLKAVDATDATLPAGTRVGDFQLQGLKDLGMRPYLILDSGSDVNEPGEREKSFAAGVLQKYGQYFDRLEVGNEVDHPYYNWDTLKLGLAYANIQRQSAVGQWLKTQDKDGDLKILGEGWYHAWDFGVVDAQARQETPEDPAWTDELSAHNYGRSYILPAATYHLLYGTVAPKPIWVTECGSYTENDAKIADFDLNLRGNLAFADYVVQYLAWPYSDQMRRFSLFSAQSKDARVLEKARCYRRLLLSYGLPGQPLPWGHARPEAMQDKAVLVNPVDAGKAYKIALVNHTHEAQSVDVAVTLGERGLYKAQRMGDGATVSEAMKEVFLKATPQVRLQETLAPGEAVEYLVEKTPMAALPAEPAAAARKAGLSNTDRYTWSQVTIGGGGFVTGVYVHPRQKDAVFVRTDVGGFLRWDATGHRWQPLMTFLGRKQSNQYGGEALALDPGNPRVLYVAAGKYTGDWAGKGRLWKSVDGGDIWSPLPLELPMGGNEDKRWGGERLAVDPFDSNHILFGSRTAGLWRSRDGGASWKQVTPAPPGKRGVGILSVLFSPEKAGHIWLNVYGEGIYSTSDGGEEWRLLAGGPRNALRLASAPGAVLYATTEPAPAGSTVAKPLSVPANGDMTLGEAVPRGWSVTFGDVTAKRDTAVFRGAPASLAVQGEKAASSGTAGATFDAPLRPFRVTGWVQSAGACTEAQVALQVFDGNWKQLDWVVLADAREKRQWSPFSRDITLPAGAAKCILVASVKGQGTLWLDDVVLQERDPRAIVPGYGVLKWRGEKWETVSPAGEAGGFCALAVNLANGQEVVVGAGDSRHTQLYRSTDGAATWKPLAQQAHNTVPWWDATDFLCHVASVTFDPHAPGTVWATDWYGVYHTSDINAPAVRWTNLEQGHEELVVFGLLAPSSGYPLVSAVADRDGFAHDRGPEAFPSKTFSANGRTGPWYQDTYGLAACASQPLRLARVGGNKWNSAFWGATSEDGGLTWKDFGPRTDKMLLRVAVSAIEPENMVVMDVDGQLRFTRDNGRTWSAASGLPAISAVKPGSPWYWGQPLAADAVQTGTFYYVCGGTLWRSRDGGATFTAVATKLPNLYDPVLTVHPGKGGALWLGARGQGLWQSTDGGENWKRSAGVMEAHLVAAGPAAAGLGAPGDTARAALYLQGQIQGHGEGIFRSLDGGTSWARISVPEFTVGNEPVVMSASLSEPGTVFIGTNGSGVFRGSVAAPGAPATR